MKFAIIRRLAAVVTLALAPALLTPDFSEARRMSPAASGAAMEACMVSGDAQFGDNSMFFGCCSKEAGLCVICDKPPSPTGQDSCNVVSYSRTKLGGMKSLSEQGFANKYHK